MTRLATPNNRRRFYGVKGQFLVKPGFQSEENTKDPAIAGRALKAARALAGVSQEEAAAVVGVTAGTLSRWERGAQAISPAQQGRLQHYYQSVMLDKRVEAVHQEQLRDLRSANDRRREKLPPRAYEKVYRYVEKLRNADIPEEMIDEAERLMVDPLYSKINKRDIRERSTEDLITDIDAAWSWIREVVEREWGKQLK